MRHRDGGPRHVPVLPTTYLTSNASHHGVTVCDQEKCCELIRVMSAVVWPSRRSGGAQNGRV
jgi:hypothetical protein